MVDENTGIAKIRESLGELALGRSDSFVVQRWLNTLIESAVQHPRLSTFAPFQEYFVDQRPIEDQLSSFLAGEFSSLIPGTDESQMTTFRLALANQLSAPEAFTTRSGDRLVISDLYQTLFSWLANTHVLSALNTAQKVVQDPRIAEISLPDSQPLALFLFRALNVQLAPKARGRSFYQAVFQFALDAPDAVAADIPCIIEANVRALGDDNDMLRRLFSEYSVLRTAYRRYLSNHYPKLFEKYETRFMAKINAALPREFSVCLEALDTPSRTPTNAEMAEKTKKQKNLCAIDRIKGSVRKTTLRKQKNVERAFCKTQANSSSDIASLHDDWILISTLHDSLDLAAKFRPDSTKNPFKPSKRV